MIGSNVVQLSAARHASHTSGTESAPVETGALVAELAQLRDRLILLHCLAVEAERRGSGLPNRAEINAAMDAIDVKLRKGAQALK